MIKKILFGLFLITFSATIYGEFDYKNIGKIPILHNGRLKPLNSLAEYTLIHLREKKSILRDNKKISINQWLFEVFIDSTKTDKDDVFYIPDERVRTSFNLKNEKYISFNELSPYLTKIEEQIQKITEIEPNERSTYQKNLVHLWQKITLYLSLKYTFTPYQDIPFSEYLTEYQKILKPGLTAFQTYNKTGTIPTDERANLILKYNQYFKFHTQAKEASNIFLYPNESKTDSLAWSNTGSELMKLMDISRSPHHLLTMFAALSAAYHENDPQSFNQYTSDILAFHFKNKSLNYLINLEYLYNQINPLYIAMICYVLIFVMYLTHSLKPNKTLYKLTMYGTVFTFILHSLGLIFRMIISGRPPVTNLYSSAVFVGWFAVFLALIQEKFFKNNLAPIISSIIGFLTLIIAYHLSYQGDTLEMLQAVLDSNFWLSTHVITITLGYSGTFLAGFIGIYTIIKDFFNNMSTKHRQEVYKMCYGVICFSLLFSFVGTVLGGIWADQSWGRFWGWDPKENGALLIVLWNALMLHARMAGVIQIKGFMLMSIFGNIVTSFSWFGVNMLGVGLHSYGFMEEEFYWLLGFCIINLLIIMLGFFVKTKNNLPST